jgi:hypothetical protein
MTIWLVVLSLARDQHMVASPTVSQDNELQLPARVILEIINPTGQDSKLKMFLVIILGFTSQSRNERNPANLTS